MTTYDNLDRDQVFRIEAGKILAEAGLLGKNAEFAPLIIGKLAQYLKTGTYNGRYV